MPMLSMKPYINEEFARIQNEEEHIQSDGRQNEKNGTENGVDNGVDSIMEKFSAAMQETLKQYGSKRRATAIRLALIILEDSDVTINEMTQRTGFSSDTGGCYNRKTTYLTNHAKIMYTMNAGINTLYTRQAE
ncbi:MAG: hypothetical protein IJI57_05775 [Flexilinea sp.]|nr:hypothetical protein [Flexilinea sp.]